MRQDQPTSAAAARGALKPVLMAGGMIAIVSALPLLGAGTAQDTLSQLVAQGGVRGPAMFLVLATFLTAIGLPRQIPCFVAGFAFGPWYGTAIALVAQTLACSLDFIWARALGRDFVRRRFGARLRKVDRMLERQPFITVLTLRLQSAAQPGGRPFRRARGAVHRRFRHRVSAANIDFRDVRAGLGAVACAYAADRRRLVRGFRDRRAGDVPPPAGPGRFEGLTAF